MSLPTSPSRRELENDLTAEDVRRLAADSSLQVLQASSPIESRTWELLNELLLPLRPDVELRVYGFYSKECDLSFLELLSNVVRFSADCLMHASGVEHIASLRCLRSLTIGIFSLESFDFLKDIQGQQLHTLGLCATRSRRPDLSVLTTFPNLRELYLEGQHKNVEVVGELDQLEDLTLRSISTDDLAFLRSLQSLWSLDIKLGGVKSLSALEGMSQVRYLELWQVRGLSDIEVISRMPGLQNIFLQSLRNVVRIPDLNALVGLRRLYLENMKGLQDISGLVGAPSLQEFAHAMSNLNPSDYEALVRMPSLKRASVWFGSKEKNDAFRAMADRHGIAVYEHAAFHYEVPGAA